MYTVLSKIIKDFRPTGRESGDGEILSLLRDSTDECYIDNAGNFVGVIKGNKDSGKRIMLETNMDGSGFVITAAEENGCLRFGPTGELSLGSTAYTEAVTSGGVRGIITPDGEICGDHLKYTLDIGADSRAGAYKKVKSGEFVTPAPHLLTLGSGKHKEYSGYPVSGRAAVAVLIMLCEVLQRDRGDNTVYIVLSVEGQNGSRMAGTAAAGIKPHEAIGIGYADKKVVGDGAVITVQRDNFVSDGDLVDKALKICNDLDIAYTVGVSDKGITPGGKIMTEGMGTPTLELDLPVKRLHTVSETVSDRDMTSLLFLLDNLCR